MISENTTVPDIYVVGDFNYPEIIDRLGNMEIKTVKPDGLLQARILLSSDRDTKIRKYAEIFYWKDIWLF